jgi:hypothetical protein
MKNPKLVEIKMRNIVARGVFLFTYVKRFPLYPYARGEREDGKAMIFGMPGAP